jgi:hypothetical protein
VEAASRGPPAKGPARPITDAEARVIASLLGGAPTTGQERIRLSGLPERTYEVARQRLVEKGFLLDRFVPNPVALGWTQAIAALGVPYAESSSRQSELWETSPDNVLLWRGRDCLFGIFLGSPSRSDGKLGRSMAEPSFQREAFSRLKVVSADLRRPQLPVYFDFSGVWNHITGSPSPIDYPRSFPHRGDLSFVPPASCREQVRQLLAVPFLPHDARNPGLELARRYSRSRKYRDRLTGTVSRRYFLDPSCFPSPQGGPPLETVLLCGKLLMGVESSTPFLYLKTYCHVNPFLYISDGANVMMGCLSARRNSAGQPGSEAREKWVSSGLAAYMEGLEVFRTPNEEWIARVNHRYDRLGESDSMSSIGD